MWIEPERVATASKATLGRISQPGGPGPAHVQWPFERKATQGLPWFGLRELQHGIALTRADEKLVVLTRTDFATVLGWVLPAGARMTIASDCDATGMMIQSESGEYEM